MNVSKPPLGEHNDVNMARHQLKELHLRAHLLRCGLGCHPTHHTPPEVFCLVSECSCACSAAIGKVLDADWLIGPGHAHVVGCVRAAACELS